MHHVYGHDPALPPLPFNEHVEKYTPESWTRLQVAIERATKTGIPYDLDLEIVCSDGKHKWITARGEAVRDEESRIIALRGTVQDITERKRAEEEILRLNAELERRVIERTVQLQATNVELQDAAEAKDRFLANMSHELRTPLNGIIGFAEFLVDGKPGTVNPKQTEYLNDILDSGKHLLQLIGDILDLAKVGAGKMVLNPEKFLLANAIGEVCAVNKLIAQNKSIHIEVNVAPEIGDVTLDQQMFKQVLYNLLSNAVKFSHKGGKIEIRAEPHETDRFKLVVNDAGIGIKAEDIGRLFKEFEQLDSGATRHHEGTGLGLVLTRKIVELQGGTIGVESEIGRGSSFAVSLPLVMPEASV